jgi:hypothetical protein
MRIHWFSFTVHAPVDYAYKLWKKYFFDSLGELVKTERRGRGFEHIDVALMECKLYHSPMKSKEKETKLTEYFHIELTGEGCDCLVPTIFQDLFLELKHSDYKYLVTRLDIAWDDLPFTPSEFCQAVLNGYAVTCAKRESLSIVQSPYELRDNGVLGTSTCYLGSKDSARFIRVYDRRGGTRLEFVMKDERATVVCDDIFQHHYQDWDFVSRENLVQYINFTVDFSVWYDFVNFAQSADIIISSARRVSLAKMESWFDRQVSVALSVYFDVWGHRVARRRLFRLIRHASVTRDRSRYSSVLQLSNK